MKTIISLAINVTAAEMKNPDALFDKIDTLKQKFAERYGKTVTLSTTKSVEEVELEKELKALCEEKGLPIPSRFRQSKAEKLEGMSRADSMRNEIAFIKAHGIPRSTQPREILRSLGEQKAVAAAPKPAKKETAKKDAKK